MATLVALFYSGFGVAGHRMGGEVVSPKASGEFRDVCFDKSTMMSHSKVNTI